MTSQSDEKENTEASQNDGKNDKRLHKVTKKCISTSK